MVKTRTWVCVTVVILALATAASVFIWTRPARGKIAKIYVDGELWREVDLDAVDRRERLTVSTERGENVLLIEPGRIRVESADCPDKVCVDAGWLSDSAAPIVCLPHRLVIELDGETALDTEVG